MSKDNIKNIFSTPIYEASFKIKDKEKEYLKNINLSDVQFKNGLMSNDKHILHREELSSVKNQITKHIEEYKNNTLQVADDIEIYHLL